MKHTPTPWGLGKTDLNYSTIIVKDDRIIARLGSSDFLKAEADAALIVRAVNAHEELANAVALALFDHQRVEPHHSDLCQLCCALKQAVAKAEGK